MKFTKFYLKTNQGELFKANTEMPLTIEECKTEALKTNKTITGVLAVVK